METLLNTIFRQVSLLTYLQPARALEEENERMVQIDWQPNLQDVNSLSATVAIYLKNQKMLSLFIFFVQYSNLPRISIVMSITPFVVVLVVVVVSQILVSRPQWLAAFLHMPLLFNLFLLSLLIKHFKTQSNLLYDIIICKF